MTRICLIALVAATVAVICFDLMASIGFPEVQLSISLGWQNVPWMLAAIHAAYWIAKVLFTIAVHRS